MRRGVRVTAAPAFVANGRLKVDDGYVHPNAATHKIMAAKLEQALKADLGW